MSAKKPLEGIKVIELGQLIAGPFAGKMFAEFGAEVIKIEAPEGGDPLRQWRKLHNGTSLWWYAQARNKKSVTVNLRLEQGQEIVRKLARDADIVIENFRPGTMEKWGLGYERLAAENPGLIMLRLSGFGQTGPYRDQAGFGAIGESMGGLRYITGHPDRPPVRSNLSIGDSLASLHGVIGAMMALHHRNMNGGRVSGKGQVVDVALYEAVFAMLESTLPEFDMYGVVRERSGSNLSGIVPSNTYLTKDGQHARPWDARTSAATLRSPTTPGAPNAPRNSMPPSAAGLPSTLQPHCSACSMKPKCQTARFTALPTSRATRSIWRAK